MPENGPEYSNSEKVAAGVIGLALLGFVVYGLMTGDVSSSRYPSSNRATHPLIYWLHMLIFAIGAVGASLIATGHVRRVPAAAAPPAENIAGKLALLSIVGSLGSAYAWWTETSDGRTAPMTGWVALAFLGMATWPPALPPARSVWRSALREPPPSLLRR